MVTPNANTADSTIYDFDDDEISFVVPTGDLPIATGMSPDSNTYYVSNFLDSTTTVIDTDTGFVLANINLLANYNPITGARTDINGDGFGDWGALPIQTPVSPDGKYVVTPNTLSNTITIIDAEENELIKALPCDAGCHGVNFGAKQGGGYYAYVSSKFANTMIVVDMDTLKIVGRIVLDATATTKTDDEIVDNDDYRGMGGQGVLPIPLVYNGWVQELPNKWQKLLTDEQLDPLGEDEDDED
jgi:DNA-binding beta-propeller fold protein YncE